LVAADDLPSITELQHAYIKENGGLANIQNLTSLVANGEILDSETAQYPFKLYRKRPDKMRFQLSLPNGVERMTCFDGRHGFTVISRPDMPDEILDLSPAENEALQVTSSLDGPFFQLRARPEYLEVVAEVLVDGSAAYEIEVKEEAHSIYDRVWISQEHFQEVKLSRPIKEEGQPVNVEEIYFSNFEKIQGMWVAKSIRYEMDGQQVQAIQIDRLRANIGIFDNYFAKPKQ
jgi:hypothetical protein